MGTEKLQLNVWRGVCVGRGSQTAGCFAHRGECVHAGGEARLPSTLLDVCITQTGYSSWLPDSLLCLPASYRGNRIKRCTRLNGAQDWPPPSGPNDIVPPGKGLGGRGLLVYHT